MGVFGKIFGAQEIIEKGMDAIGLMVFTDEEKSKAKLELLKAYAPFKLAQRYLAFMFGGTFLIVFLNAVLIWNIGVFTSNLDRAGYLMEVAFELAKWNVDTLGVPISAIFGLYFLGGVMKGKRKDT